MDLVGVELWQQTVGLAGQQDPPGFLRRKDALLAEHIAEPGQPFRRRPGDHLLTKQPEIALPVGLIFRRQSVGSQKGGGQIHGAFLPQLPDDPQLPQLGLRFQTVAALGFAGGDAEALHFQKGAPALFQKLRLRGGAGGPHGGKDPAAPGQNVQIGDAVELVGQLILPPAAEDQMGMGVGQTGRGQSALRVDDLLRPAGRLALTYGSDDPVLRQHPGIF